MNDIEHSNRQIHHVPNPFSAITRQRRTNRQRNSPSPERRVASGGGLAPLDLHQPTPSPNANSALASLITAAGPMAASSASTPGAGNSNSLPGHQTSRSKLPNNNLQTPNFGDHQNLNLSDSLNSGGGGDHDMPSSDNSPLSRKKNLSTSDLDPFERKKQAALTKVEAKLEKAQRLHQTAQQGVEQNISEFLRVTVPGSGGTGGGESTSSQTTKAAFDKRIRTLQDTKKELEKKIANYQADILRIQAGDIPHHHTSSKDILNNIKSTAAKVAGGSLKHRSTNVDSQASSTFSSTPQEPSMPSHYADSEPIHHYQHHPASPMPSLTVSTTSTGHSSGTGTMNNNQNVTLHNQHSNTLDAVHSSLSSSASNEIGNSQFYIDANHEHVYDGDKSNRKYETNPSVDTSNIHDIDKSPLSRRRPTDDSTNDYNDRASDHSSDDRMVSTSSKRNASTAHDHQFQLKIDAMQKTIDRFEIKVVEMQKQIDSLELSFNTQREQNERLICDMTDLTELHQNEISSLKTDSKNLEDRLVYKFNDYWNEMLEKLEKLDTRTAKVEQTQTHSLETEENTHRIISKLVNILLTVFAIILLLLSTIKNVVQSRLHAMTILIIVLAWLTFHYLPPNYFQTLYFKNFFNLFKR